MIVESLWKTIKHKDLKKYNCPRLDLITHIVLTSVLPHVKLTLDYMLGLRKRGCLIPLAGWQTEFCANWLNMSCSDEHHLTKKELKLAKIEEKKTRLHEKYKTNIEHWTCSCPAYLISQFLLSKHLIRDANKILKDKPLTDLAFFKKLCWQCYPPYYLIEGIHTEVSMMEESEKVVKVQILGCIQKETCSESRKTSSSLGVKVQEQPEKDNEHGKATNPSVKKAHDSDGDNDSNDEDDSNMQVLYSATEKLYLWECFENMVVVIDRPVHMKMAVQLDIAFKLLKNIGGDVGRHLSCRVGQRTWKDSNMNIM
ncbi:hypothetical protein Hypma_001561 [Hypsizygus marmoreus]|uniref:Uncharacterized protein n=1 Tax=Hypsizygus marmoreus TaxID=39966 RepID=A0A369K8H2_HYPMA|nr:hypothetical protein Hypma_001561 [Hypsizygus marmoreus]